LHLLPLPSPHPIILFSLWQLSLSDVSYVFVIPPLWSSWKKGLGSSSPLYLQQRAV
jgi:hypothetical protein